MSHIWAKDCHGGSSIVCHDLQMGQGGKVHRAAGKVAGQLSTLINPLLSHISDSNPPTNRL